MEVLKDTETVDNRVELQRGGKKTAYRCVLCAIADVKDGKGDLTILTPSERKGKPVKIVRTDGKWTAEPETAQFVYVKGSHAQCEVRYRAITTKEALDAYLANNPRVLKSAKSISLAEMIKRSE